MAELSGTFVLSGPDGEPHTFLEGSTDVPEWAVEKIGEHGWKDGKKPAKKAAAKPSDK